MSENNLLPQIEGLLSYLDKYCTEDKVPDAKLIKSVQETIFNFSQHITRKEALELKKIGLRMYNLAIKLSHNKNNDSLINSLIRHCASDCMKLSLRYSEEGEESHITSIVFYVKTGKCYYDLADYKSANECFNRATEVWINMSQLFTNPSQVEDEKRKKTLLPFYCAKITTLWQLEQIDNCFVTLQKAKEILKELPYEIVNVAMMCYDMGVNCTKQFKQNNQHAIKWLEESVEIYQLDNTRDKSKQARTLRLLSKLYLDTNNYDKALKSILLANQENVHPAGFYLCCKLYMIKRNNDLAANYFELTLRNSETLDMSLAACYSAIEYQYIDLSMKGYDILIERYSNDYKGIGKIKLMKLEALSTAIEKEINVNDINEYSLFKYIQLILSNHINGLDKLDTETLNEFRIKIWNGGINKYQKDKYNECIEWLLLYEQSLTNDDLNLKMKCYRVIARSYINLNNYIDAEKYGLQCTAIEHSSSINYFLLFKIAIQSKNESKAIEYIEQIMKCNDCNISHIEVCAYEAIESKQIQTSIYILNYLITNNNIQLSDGQIGIFLRNLIKISIDQSCNINTIIKYLEKGLLKIEQLGIDKVFKNNNDELLWFYSISWNLAIKEMNNNNNNDITTNQFDISSQLFNISYKYSNYISLSNSLYFDIQKKSLLLYCITSIDYCINNYYNAVNSTTNTNNIKKIIDCINKCKQLHDKQQSVTQINNNNSNNNSNSNINTTIIDNNKWTIMITILEFECKLLLEDKEVITLIKKCVIQEKSKEIMEIMSSIVINNYNKKKCKEEYNKELIIEILNEIIEFYKKEGITEVNKSIMLIRNIITMYDNKMETTMIMNYYEQVIKIYNQIKENKEIVVKIEEEMKWYIINAYNKAVYIYRAKNYILAEKWLKIAITIDNLINNNNNENRQDNEITKRLMNSYAEVLNYVSSNNSDN